MKKKMDKKDKEIDRLSMLVQDKVFSIVYLFGVMREVRDLLEKAMIKVNKDKNDIQNNHNISS